MYYVFDNAGWYLSSSNEPDPRSTELDPVNYSTSTVDGAVRANWTGTAWVDRTYLAPVVGPAVVAEAKLTRLAFRTRFTQAEKIGLELASLDNPAADMSVRALAAGLRVALADQRDATFIDLNLAATRAGVEQLAAFGLLAVGRAAQILGTPVHDDERYVVNSQDSA